MPELTIEITPLTLARLEAVKKLQGKGKQAPSEFAGELIEETLAQLFPCTPQYDNYGVLINPDRYTG